MKIWLPQNPSSFHSLLNLSLLSHQPLYNLTVKWPYNCVLDMCAHAPARASVARLLFVAVGDTDDHGKVDKPLLAFFAWARAILRMLGLEFS